MTAAEIKNEVDAIIEKTFERLQKVYQNSKKPNANKCDSRLIFPKYRNGELRISEQELRCAFVEEFKDSAYAKNKNWHYSIETPTREIYSFSEDTPRVVTQQNGSIYFNPADKKRGFKSIIAKTKRPDFKNETSKKKRVSRSFRKPSLNTI